jgi:hypothetical protein
MAGYSGTPLAKKLGIKEGARVLLVEAPEDFAGTLDPLPPAVDLAPAGEIDVALLFCSWEEDLLRLFPDLAARLARAGGLWIAWPKKSARLPTDLAFDVVQKVGLEAGLVDNKVCAVSEVWSGLRFVRRLKDR